MLVQVFDVTLCYKAVAGYSLKECSPANGGDITSLLQKLPAMPSLRAARITATRRAVGPVNMCCMAHLKHLAIACAELALSSVDNWDPTWGPISFHLVAETTSKQTVGQALGLFASCLSAALA